MKSISPSETPEPNDNITETEDGHRVRTDAETVDFEQKRNEALDADEDELSHVELDPSVFHASSMGYTCRHILLSKYGLQEHDHETLGRFKTGTLIHEFFENTMDISNAEFEAPIRHEEDGITFVGHTDVVDRDNGQIIDFKTRASWYRHEPPTQRHLDQLLIYMKATGLTEGRIIYVSKADLEMRPWPEDGVFLFDEDRYNELVEKAKTVRDAILENGVPMQADQIVFEQGDDWISQQETLRDWF